MENNNFFNNYKNNLKENKWIKSLIRKDYSYILDNAEEYTNLFINKSLFLYLKFSSDNSYNQIKYFINGNRNLLLFSTYRVLDDPYNIILKNNDDIIEEFEKIEFQEFTLTRDPILAFKNLEIFLKNKYPHIWSDKITKNYNEKKNNLFNFYEKNKIKNLYFYN